MRQKLPAIIVDIDYCVVDASPMRPFYPKDDNSREEWDEFHLHTGKCQPNAPVIELVRGMEGKGYIPIFITAREDRGACRVETDKLVRNVCKFYYELFMRPDKCYLSSSEVKRDIVLNKVIDKYDVLFALDDDKDNINMYLSLGIPSLVYFQVTDGINYNSFGVRRNGQN